MVRPKPHRNLFLRWFRKAQRDSVRGKGGSFFSSVAPTIQLLFTEPVGQEWGRDLGGLMCLVPYHCGSHNRPVSICPVTCETATWTCSSLALGTLEWWLP